MQNYSYLEKKLHDLILNNRFINKSLFEIEKLFFLEKKNKNNESKHIFITSLPRSGTTLLLNYIYLSDEFYSLTYRNMPFIMAPNFSKFFKKKIFLQKKERFHKDGVMYDLDSPESFDEVFFKTFNDKNDNKNTLFVDFVSLVTKNNKKKYLSKNNNNYKRIEFLTSTFPNSSILIPIRSPIDHSHSLHTQHLNFCDLQKKDSFILRYMNYLGHNEFGINHMPWSNPINYKNLDDINYWLEQWFLFYQNIYDKYKKNQNCTFVVYENFAKKNFWELLNKKINVKKNTDIKFNFKEKNVDKFLFDQKLLNRCLEFYKIFFSA